MNIRQIVIRNQRGKMDGPEKLRFIEALETSEEKIEFVNTLLATLTEKPFVTA